MKGSTNAKASTVKGETLYLQIEGIENPTVTITYDDVINTYTGNDLEILIPGDVNYTVSFSEVEEYISPESVSYTSVTYNTRILKVEYVYNPAIDLSMLDIYGNSINQSTANCYVVSEPGQYKFPLVFGNALKNGSINSAAYTKNSGSNSHDFVDYNGTIISSPYIETVSGEASSVQLSIADTDGVFTDINLINGTNCRYVQFTIVNVPVTGTNGIISIKNDSGVIMWSWHVWVWPHDLSVVEITNSTGVKYNIMPVNLATKLDDGTVYGTGTTGYKNWFYQFGRPTPLLCPSTYNSTSNHTSYGALSFTIADAVSNLYNGIQNPTTFYKYDSNSDNWFKSNSDKNYNLWDAECTTTGNSDNNVVKTVYDPCPVGFKIPNGNTFTYFSTSNVVGSFKNGWKLKRYSGDTVGIFFPASGYRLSSNGSLSNVDSFCKVWLSSAYSQYSAYSMCFDSSGVYPHLNFMRAEGLSVRPVQE